MDQIKNKIKNILSGKENLSKVALGDFISSFIGALFWLFVAALLTPEEYGEVSYVIGIAAVVSTLSLVGAYNSIIVLTSKNVKIQSSMNFLSSIVGLFASLVVYLVLDKIEVSLLIFTYIFTNLVIPQIIGKKEYTQYFKYSIFSKILLVISSLVLFHFFGYIGIIFGISMPVLLFGYKIFQTFRQIKIDLKLFRVHSKFVFSNYVMSIAEIFAGSLDKLIIGPILGFAILGSYQLGLQFLGILLIIPGIVYKITLPDDARDVTNKKLKLLTIMISIFLGFLAFILIPTVIPFINSGYNDTILPIQIIAIAVIPGTVSLMYLSKFIGNEKNKIILVSSIIQALSIIILIIILGHYLQAIGIALAYLLTQIISMSYLIYVSQFLREKEV